MQNCDITNNHLKDVIDNLRTYLEKEEETPAELVLKFVFELKVSNLLIPAIEEDDAFSFERLESDDSDASYIPLFTDIEEYSNHVTEDLGYEPQTFDFDTYKELVMENDFEGIVINVESSSMPVDRDFLSNMLFDVDKVSDEDYEPYSPEKIKEIFETAENDSLLEFIRDEERNTDIEKLYVELSNSTLLNLTVSDDPLDEFAQDGIIDADDIDGFNLCCFEDDNIRFGAVFTDRQSINKILEADTELCYYGQVTVLSALFEYILRNDMDGVIINPGKDDYFITRDEILPQASGIEVVIDDPCLENAPDYSFIL